MCPVPVKAPAEAETEKMDFLFKSRRDVRVLDEEAVRDRARGVVPAAAGAWAVETDPAPARAESAYARIAAGNKPTFRERPVTK